MWWNLKIEVRDGEKSIDFESLSSKSKREVHALIKQGCVAGEIEEEKDMQKVTYNSDRICFEHDGVEYSLTRGEIDAAWAFKEKELRLEDAERHLEYLVFGCDRDELDDIEIIACIDFFEQRFGVSYADALDMKELFVVQYDNIFDCNTAENVLWNESIFSVLESANRHS